MMVRKPIVSGSFYEKDKEALIEQIKGCFLSSFGPGSLPKINKDTEGKRVFGAICPHAGLTFSGPCAAYSYKRIAENGKFDAFIILGLSHQGYRSCVSLDNWETPLGIAENDTHFGKEIIKNCNLDLNEKAHQSEHSIEVQIPFLQYILKEDIKIVPIIVSGDINYPKIAQGIINTIKDSKKKVCIIASSDFTHYGINYGYYPFNNNIKERMYGLDKRAIGHIKNLDSEKFLGYIEDTGATICGKHPISLLLQASKLMGKKDVELLRYYTSGDVVGDYTSAVGYASIIIE